MKTKKDNEGNEGLLILVTCNACNHRWLENYNIREDEPLTLECPFCGMTFQID